MSIRSKVRLGVEKEGLSFLKDYMEKEVGKDNYIEDSEVFAEDENVLFIGWDWINFSKSVPSVKAIYNGIREMEKKGHPCRMIIIGENYSVYGDIEIIDMDPEGIIPYMYTEIDVTYDI